MEERHKIIDGEVHLLWNALAYFDGEIKLVKKAKRRLLIVEVDYNQCFVVVGPVEGSSATGIMLPIKEKFDELEKVSEKQNK